MVKKNNHYTRLIVDFDDTLAHTTQRNWDEATPNLKLIEKTNKLYDDGWNIDIYTARGSLSCKTREEAEKKYRNSMLNWLTKNNVKYHSLSFNKPLAAYYIDDKAITPQSFLEIDIRQLKDGLSNSTIYTDGKLVHKTDKNSHIVNDWFNTVKNDIFVPKVERIIGDTITMEYIDHDKLFYHKKPYIAIGIIQQTLQTFKQFAYFQHSTFNDYIERIKNHIKLANLPEWYDITLSLKDINLKQSFSHGDFGITNMLFKNNRLCLIDPIPDVFGCTALDAAKFCASLWVNKTECFYLNNSMLHTMTRYSDITFNEFKILVMSELIRIYKYHTNKDFIKECITDVSRQV